MPKQRFEIIDALRGFALGGVVLVHMAEQYYAGPTPADWMTEVNGVGDQIVKGIIDIFFRGKFYAIFSFLFGLSFYIQLKSAEKKQGGFELRFLWRSILLLGIGYLHQLFYRGDILTIYAMLVPFFLPFHRIRNLWVLITATIMFIGLPKFLYYAIFGTKALFGIASMDFNADEQLYMETITSGSFWEVALLNLDYGMRTKMAFQLGIFGRFFYTLGYFLLGLVIGRLNIFQNLVNYKGKITNALIFSAALVAASLVLAMVTFSMAKQPVDFQSWDQIIALNFLDLINLGLAGVIVTGFMLLYTKTRWHIFLVFFAPYGRMALTNYVVQSIVFTWVFFGYGLGLIGSINTALLALMAIFMIMIQTILSKFWLRYFHYGPLEWLWRSATYFSPQPFKK